MKKFLFAGVIITAALFSFTYSTDKPTVVEKYGQLSVQGRSIIGNGGDTVQLRGMSLFWSQWMPQYYNEKTVKWLKDDWKCTIVRAAMGVEKGGYLTNPDIEKAKVEAVVDACIKEGIYVIIDYHAHEAQNDIEAAKKFFGEMAEKYGKYPNVMYETYNEPLQYDGWDTLLKPYHEEVISEIRKYDPDNIIICSSRMWTQRVDEAINNRIDDANVVYSLHYYAYSHRKPLRAIAQQAIDANLPLIISEYGNTHASGNGKHDTEQAQEWYNLLDKHKISWCKWSIADKVETSAALQPGASGDGGWTEEELTESGKYVRNEIRTKNAEF